MKYCIPSKKSFFIYLIIACILLMSAIIVKKLVVKYTDMAHIKKELAYVEKQIDILKKLGFVDNDEAMKILQEYGLRYQQKLDAISQKNHFSLHSLFSSPSQDHEQIEKLIAVHRKILKGCIRDLRDYRSMGIPEQSLLVKHTRETMIRIMIKLGTLEQQYEQVFNKKIITSYAHQIHTNLKNLALANTEFYTRTQALYENCPEVIAHLQKKYDYFHTIATSLDSTIS